MTVYMTVRRAMAAMSSEPLSRVAIGLDGEGYGSAWSVDLLVVAV
jgi:hypothetical protein